MCSDDEWNTIVNFCKNTEDSKETAASKIFGVISFIKDIFDCKKRVNECMLFELYQGFVFLAN